MYVCMYVCFVMYVGPHVMYAPSMYLRYVGMYRSCTFIINYYLCRLSVIRYFLLYIMILYLYYNLTCT